jgi:hypothetical protein
MSVFENVVEDVGEKYKTFSLPKLCSGDARLGKLPFSIRVLLESSVRNCDDKTFPKSDVETILAWKETQFEQKEIQFRPARVILQVCCAPFPPFPPCVHKTRESFPDHNFRISRAFRPWSTWLRCATR